MKKELKYISDKSNDNEKYWVLTLSSDDDEEKEKIRRYNSTEKIDLLDQQLELIVNDTIDKINKDEDLIDFSSRAEMAPPISLEEVRFYLVFKRIIE